MNIQELHNRAMELADQADMLKRGERESEAATLYRQSLEAERAAALRAHSQQIGEPTQSVLLRSAATLAYGIKEYREAERLICMALAGNPPAEIADELRSLYDAVSLEKNLEKMTTETQEKGHENVTITIPARERNLLNVIVRKFGWACAL